MLSKQQFIDFRNDCKKALEEVEKKYGVEVKIGHISYTDIDFTAKMEVTKVVTGKSKDELTFEKYCGLYNLTPKDYGREFKYGGETYKLVEINPKAPKFPFIGQNISNGIRYKFKENVINSEISLNKIERD